MKGRQKTFEVNLLQGVKLSIRIECDDEAELDREVARITAKLSEELQAKVRVAPPFPRSRMITGELPPLSPLSPSPEPYDRDEYKRSAEVEERLSIVRQICGVEEALQEG